MAMNCCALRTDLENSDGPLEIRRSVEFGSLIIHSLETGIPRVVCGNVANQNLIDNLPAGCCVEVPCLVDKNGVQTRANRTTPNPSCRTHANEH
jgi:alpha-galactosidase